MPTDFVALDALYPLALEDLPRQWVLTRDETLLPEAWEHRSHRGWHLAAHPCARVSELRSRDGATVGWAFEALAYLDPEGGRVAEGEVVLPITADAHPAEVERALYGRDERGRSSGEGLVGSWVAVVLAGAPEAPYGRVYLGAKHSVVYSSDSRAVAPTHNLVPGVRRNEALSRAFDPLATDAYFTFGLTAFEGLRRLLPNHYLDLDTFEPHRHWPVQALETLEDGAEGAAAAVDHARRVLTPLTAAYEPFRVFLSAGRDSRAVLALLRPFVEEGLRVELSTTVRPDLGSKTDLQAARRLARLAGLPHRVRRRGRSRGAPSTPGTTEHVLRGFARVGEARAGTFLGSPDGREEDGAPVKPFFFNLGGMAGETGRAYFWGPAAPAELTPEDLARRVQSPPVDAVVEAAEAWLGGLPSELRARAADVLDLAYVEQRLGCWQAPSTYLFPGRRYASNPMAEAFAIETMLRLPEPYRAAGVLQRDMVAYGWPELLTVPFNEPAGWLRLRREVGRARFHLGALRRRLFAMD